MSYNNGSPMVNRWKSPARPQSSRPSSSLIGNGRQPSAGDLGAGPRPDDGPKLPRSPQLNEDLDTLAEQLSARRLSELERRGYLLAMEVF
jgi:hypothetical protein